MKLVGKEKKVLLKSQDKIGVILQKPELKEIEFG
jgi:hypothetical protein